ncbi:hypothetical protein TraAM80_05670 [Trypanosoma rangeli]|uniref:CHASE domain-containing protein n=1 Tax=Trypanosoma rangeli TaxID=5698 RepID=A0A3R7NB09_TRYRA|nr:uncharacterized protein TraAM80_05670 [Trypanosoma rangeli]RNF03498.1 hypothetical protein TraAM80_05670 [Trypanosoma rangeli]|eukprot:RNF03498.1 hypothetical protein TraAM80_05670 [Trypanosoma rangeli]
MREKKLTPRQRRTHCFIGLGIFCAIFMAVFISVPIALYEARHQRMRDARWREEVTEAEKLVSVFTDAMNGVISTVYAHEGLVMGSIKVIPPFNASVEARTKNQNFPGFNLVASYFNSSQHLALQVLAPGGVALHLFPMVNTILMRDFLNDYSMGSPTPIQTVDTARTAVLGPLYNSLPSLNALWQLFVRGSIYNATRVADETRVNFWGFSIAVLSLDSLMDENLRGTHFWKNEMEYLIYTTDETSQRIIPIRFSRGKNLTDEGFRKFIETGTTRSVLGSSRAWYVCMRGNHQDNNPTKTTIALIVVFAVLLSILIFTGGASAVLLCLKEYDGVAHAPKVTPFALAVIGLCNAERLWELAPDHMLVVSERLAALQRRHIIRHNVYEAMQLHPYSTTVAARSVDAAVRICFSLIEELQSQPIDEPLRELLGEDGSIFIACAVHWCMDATVRVESSSDTVRYEGPDLVYCGRMWMFAAPNKVTISRAAREMALQMEGVQIVPLASVFLRGVEKRQELFTVTNPQSKRLAQASRCAGERVGPTMQCSSLVTELRQDDNPLSLGREAFASASLCPVNVAELRAAASSVSSAGLGKEVAEVGGRRGGNGVRVGGDDSPEQYLPDGKRRRKHSSQSNVPKTLIELLPTEAVEMYRLSMDESRTRAHSTTADGEQQGRTIVKGCGHGPVTRGSTTVWNIKKARPNEKNSGASSDTGHVEDSHEGDIVTEAMRRPIIPAFVDAHLRAIFERHAVILDFSYNSVRTVVFYFYSAFKLLLKPLAAPERNNVFRRLVIAFGIPSENVLEHLAVRCVLRYIRQSEEVRSMLWNREQQMRLRSLAKSAPTSLVMVDSSSTNPVSEDSLVGSLTNCPAEHGGPNAEDSWRDGKTQE